MAQDRQKPAQSGSAAQLHLISVRLAHAGAFTAKPCWAGSNISSAPQAQVMFEKNAVAPQAGQENMRMGRLLKHNPPSVLQGQALAG
jgi:hypothetical protein